MHRFLLAVLLTVVFATPALAIFALVPADRVDEVPIERLLANIKKNAQRFTLAQKWRAIGRLHLLAYLRQTDSLFVYRERPDDIAEGRIDECKILDDESTGRGTRDNFPQPKPGERCEARRYTLGPRREIPPGAENVNAAPNAHLAASLQAYSRARALEPRNFRTRVALAFVFDRLGRKGEARRELRFVAYEGMKRLAPAKEYSDWELHTVVSEAVAHLERIAEARADLRLVTVVKARLKESPPAMMVTPILVPLSSEASFEKLVDRASTVSFDFTGQGERMQLGWIKPDAAWLVWDPRDRGRVVSGFQLFGSVTWVSSWDNGYLALGALDDDGDGTLAGEELRGLALWQDANGNGKSEPGEVRSVRSHDIVGLRYTHMRASEEMWVSEAGVTFANGETRPTYDWQLRRPLLTPVKD